MTWFFILLSLVVMALAIKEASASFCRGEMADLAAFIAFAILNLVYAVWFFLEGAA